MSNGITIGVSYRMPPGPRGGKKKPVCVFKMRESKPFARIARLEAFFREVEHHKKHKTGAEVWKWEE